MPTLPHPPVARARVFDSYRAGGDWMLVAAHSCISSTSACRIVASGREEPLPRGGFRDMCVKCTPEIVAALKKYLDDNCIYTLQSMKGMVSYDFCVHISTSTISDKLIDMLYTVKQVRVEPMTCNNEQNKTKRMAFATKLRSHMSTGDFIVYYDETNFNVYWRRTQGHAKIGTRAAVMLPHLKESTSKYSVQSQPRHLHPMASVYVYGCPYSRSGWLKTSSVPVVHWDRRAYPATDTPKRVVMRSCRTGGPENIRMDVNAALVDAIYEKVKATPTYQEHFLGKKVVVVLDNAPAHSQTEDRVVEHDDLELLRLAPYSLMCNPIENWFSVLIKADLALSREELVASRPRGQIAEGRMQILERAAKRNIRCMDLRLVSEMALHCQHAVAAADRMEGMQYGTYVSSLRFALGFLCIAL
uniref:Tc1-like transposase DDE domain-containing protein n=1 Tax=Phytophthora ramorum TaxID=164328 RepID=H3GYN8_PHYRM